MKRIGSCLGLVLGRIDRQDWIILVGLGLMSGGLLVVSLAAALFVPGLLLFLLGVGAFAPRNRAS